MAKHGARRIGWRLAALAGAIPVAVWAVARAAGAGSVPPSLVAAGALLLAAAALLVAVAALRRAKATEARMLAMARAIDGALAPAARGPAALDLAEINRIVAQEVERFGRATAVAGPEPARPEAAAAGEDEGGTVVPLPSVRRPAPDRAGEELLREAIARGTFEVSLRPIVSLSAGAAVAFDAFAHLEGGADGRSFDIGRLRRAPAADAAAFERLLVKEALQASRRVVAGAAGGPLHVAVSAALLRSQAEAPAVAALLGAHREAARSIRLDIPAALLGDAAVRAALDALGDTGAAFVADFEGDGPCDAAALRRSGLRIVRVPVERLLGRQGSRRSGPDGQEPAGLAAAGLTVIADGVENDDDAMALVDLGIDLMTGRRFSGPLRLRRQDTPAAAE